MMVLVFFFCLRSRFRPEGKLGSSTLRGISGLKLDVNGIQWYSENFFYLKSCIGKTEK